MSGQLSLLNLISEAVINLMLFLVPPIKCEVSGMFIASLAVSVSIESNIEDFTSAQVLGVEEGSRSSDHLVPISEEDFAAKSRVRDK